MAYANRSAAAVKPEGNLDAQRTNWQTVMLAVLLPVMGAGAYFYLAIFYSHGDPPQMLVVATIALIPLELVRSVVLRSLADAFRQSRGPLQALRAFLFSMLCLFLVFVVARANERGVVDTFKAMTNPDTLITLGVPVLIMVIDGLLNILTFRGDPGKQARMLETLASDSAAWLQLMVARVPLAIALVYLLLFGFRSAGYAFAAWLPDPDSRILREVGWSYAGCYFLGKAVLIAHVQTPHYARTGRGLLDTAWIRWLLRKPQRAGSHSDIGSVTHAPIRPPVKSARAFEDDAIASLQEKSEARDQR
ncbi:MAG TPA: hypothetical protein VFN13_01075 [Rudaea sp.]|nr:hypothetical protein [Rudaea sp.]